MATKNETTRVRNTMRPERLAVAALVMYFQGDEPKDGNGNPNKLTRNEIGKILRISNANIGNLSGFVANFIDGKDDISGDDFEYIKEQAAEMLRNENESAKTCIANKNFENSVIGALKANISAETLFNRFLDVVNKSKSNQL